MASRGSAAKRGWQTQGREGKRPRGGSGGQTKSTCAMEMCAWVLLEGRMPHDDLQFLNSCVQNAQTKQNNCPQEGCGNKLRGLRYDAVTTDKKSSHEGGGGGGGGGGLCVCVCVCVCVWNPTRADLVACTLGPIRAKEAVRSHASGERMVPHEWRIVSPFATERVAAKPCREAHAWRSCRWPVWSFRVRCPSRPPSRRGTPPWRQPPTRSHLHVCRFGLVVRSRRHGRHTRGHGARGLCVRRRCESAGCCQRHIKRRGLRVGRRALGSRRSTRTRLLFATAGGARMRPVLQFEAHDRPHSTTKHREHRPAQQPAWGGARGRPSFPIGCQPRSARSRCPCVRGASTFKKPALVDKVSQN